MAAIIICLSDGIGVPGMSARGTKRTNPPRRWTSANDPKRTSELQVNAALRLTPTSTGLI
jgi:hypothetical protein